MSEAGHAGRSQTPPIDIVEYASAGALTPMQILNRVLMDPTVSIEKLEKVMNMAERWEANEARKAFDEAMAAAKAEIPVIVKNREVDYTSQKGRTNYRHEDLGEIARSVDPILARHGLAYRYRTEQDSGTVKVTCIVSHRDGHYEENALSAGYDQTGNKNSIQALGSTTTYLQRYTLKSALGLAVSSDDDGRGSGERNNAPVSENQLNQLIALADEVGADKGAFVAWLSKALKMEINALAEIPASAFDRAMKALEKKRGQANADS